MCFRLSNFRLGFYDDPEDPDAGYDHLYFYYNTLSGRVRLIDNVLGDIYVDVNQNTANSAAIYNYLYTRLNDFEDKSLDAFNDIIDLIISVIHGLELFLLELITFL